MKIKVFALSLTFVLCLKGWSQDPEFTQFYSSPLYLNPAYTGTTINPKFHINFRDQWPAISHAYVSYAVSYDQYFEDLKSGIGIHLVGDRAGNGIYNTYGAFASYSYQANLSGDFALKLGIQGGMQQRRLDATKIFFYDQINPVTGFVDAGNNTNPTSEPSNFNTSQLYGDLSLGALVFSRRFIMGVAAKHLNQPAESFSRDLQGNLPIKYNAHIGVILGGESRNDVTFSPNILYTQQFLFRQLNAGSYLKIGSIFGGAWFRYNFENADAFMLLAGVHVGVFRMGYSYDFTISDLQSQSGGAHELSITINLDDLPNARRANSGKYLTCPSLY